MWVPERLRLVRNTYFSSAKGFVSVCVFVCVAVLYYRLCVCILTFLYMNFMWARFDARTDWY